MLTNTSKALIFLAVVAVVCGVYFYFGPSSDISDIDVEDVVKHEDKIELTQQQIADAGIEIESAKAGKLQKTIQGYGKIVFHADHIAHVIPKVKGIVIKAYKNIGDSVKVNEVLALLESKEMAEAKADYLAKLKKQKLNENFLSQELQLHEKGISAEQDYLHSRFNLDEATIAFELSRQKLFSLGLDETEIDNIANMEPASLRVYEMRSPISGTVISREITQGELLDTNHEAYKIADLSTLWAIIDVFPQDLPYLTANKAATIRSADKTAKSTVSCLTPIIDENSRKAQALILLDNASGDWTPGTFVTAEIPTHFEDAPIVVSKEALQEIDGALCLFVPTAEGFEVRSVTKGRSDEVSVEILSGITNGEHYACKNTFILKAEHGKDEATHAD